MAISPRTVAIRREQLAKFLDNPMDIQKFEDQQAIIEGAPDQIQAAQDTADTANGKANNLAAAQYIVAALTSALSNERVLSGGLGVTVTFGSGTAVITINVATALGYTPADLAGATFTGPVDVQDALRANSLRLDQTASASTATITHSTPIDINGTTYYLMLSNTP